MPGPRGVEDAAPLQRRYGNFSTTANGRGGLRQRVQQYIKYGWNTAANHKGGRAVWQVENFPILLLEYEVCEDCEQREHELLAAFKRENGVYPLANWRG